MMSLAVLVFKGQGPAYSAIHFAGLTNDLEVVEIIPLGDEAQVLVKGPLTAIQTWMNDTRIKAQSATLIEKWNEKIERAFYSLDLQSPEQNFLIVEGPSLGKLFQAASQMIELGWKIIDLKIPRGSVKWGTLIATSADADPQLIQSKIAADLQISVIPQASAMLRRYFEIEA